MIKAGIDQDAIAELFSKATARQGDMLRNAVTTATLQAFQGRELTLENLRRVLKAVAVATAQGLAENKGRPATLEALLNRSIEGMDVALVKAVDANRTALRQFMDLGVGLQAEQMQLALDSLGRVEAVFLSVLGRLAPTLGTPLLRPWQRALDRVQAGGTDAGGQAALVVSQLIERSHAALRKGRAANVRAAQTMMDNYASLVSGVLMGLTEAIVQSSSADKPASRGRGR